MSEAFATITSGSIDKLAGCIRDHLQRQFGIPVTDNYAHDWVIMSTPEPHKDHIGSSHGRRRILVEIEVRLP
jgi:hypothetical protein